ncbi:MAG: STAS domain-containing protein [Chitinophagaceae bacterium]
MNVKLETKERFHVIKMLSPKASAIMAEELNTLVINCLKTPIKNIIIDMELVEDIEPSFAQNLIGLQEKALEDNRSLVMFHLHKNASKKLEEMDIIDMLNITPTESEAWDIIHMEEMEREMFGDDEKQVN